jgi:hypothetical protein
MVHNRMSLIVAALMILALVGKAAGGDAAFTRARGEQSSKPRLIRGRPGRLGGNGAWSGSNGWYNSLVPQAGRTITGALKFNF